MSYPNIRSNRENFFNHWITPMRNRFNFLRRNPQEARWLKQKAPAPVNIIERNELFEMELAMPGFKKSELSITLNNGLLKVRGERSRMEANVNPMIIQEYDYDVMERNFTISPTISMERVEAKYEDGILRLKFLDVPPQEERKVRRVAVA